MRGVPNDTGLLAKSGTLIDCVVESITCPRAFSTTMRISTGPGGTVKATLAPAAAPGAGAAGGPGAAATSGALSPTGPRNTGRPSGVVAVSITRAAVSVARDPSPDAIGSQTNCTRVWPPAAISMPVQKRAARPLAAGLALALSASAVCGGGAALGGVVARH